MKLASSSENMRMLRGYRNAYQPCRILLLHLLAVHLVAYITRSFSPYGPDMSQIAALIADVTQDGQGLSPWGPTG